MDFSNDGAYSRTQNIPSGRVLEGGPSGDARPVATPRLLQKKPSNAGARTRNQPQAGPSGLRRDSARDTIGAREGAKVRKGSLRNAVRRIFGRRSRDVEPLASQTTSPRHGYHASEPAGLTPPRENIGDPMEVDELVQRTLSVPVSGRPTQGSSRYRSPNAVEFPHSSRLKPLDLGNPYTAPGSQLRRRKTLPTVLMPDSAADVPTASAAPYDPPAISGREAIHDPVGSESARRLSTIKSEKRKSRSADDLTYSPSEAASPARRRSQEIRFWRESLQGSVLRSSGFVAQGPTLVGPEEQEGDKTPMPRDNDPFVDNQLGQYGNTPLSRRDLSERDYTSPSAFGTEMSRELEDRVAKLEANLQNFRGQLTQLASDRNRKTVLIGPTRGRRASSGGRTASLLAQDLQSDLQPSSYAYDYTQTLRRRTSTSPTRPRTPTYTDPTDVALNPPMPDREAPQPFSSPSASSSAPRASSQGANRANLRMPQQHTFQSLYEMLTDERSARRKLERQMKHLQAEIANLHQQVSNPQSNIQSQRGSYYAPMDPMVGSSRLHALLRDVDPSPPSTAQSQQQYSDRFATQRETMISRFSGSESDTGGTESDLQTPHEAYRTPVEDAGMFQFGTPSRDDGGMF